MTPIQAAFLKEGWIQVGGEDIPVFFKYEPSDKTYPFLIIFGAPEYYYLYNEWVTKGYTTADKLDAKSIAKTYEQLRATPEMFHIAIMQHLSDYYLWRARGDHENSSKFMTESSNYQFFSEYLRSKLKSKENVKTEENSSKS